jgi:hypothetical protein
VSGATIQARRAKSSRWKAELRKLSQTELRQIREWLDDIIEDELEFRPEFKRTVQQSERDMAEGRSSRVREPEGSLVRRSATRRQPLRAAFSTRGGRYANAVSERALKHTLQTDPSESLGTANASPFHSLTIAALVKVGATWFEVHRFNVDSGEFIFPRHNLWWACPSLP